MTTTLRPGLRLPDLLLVMKVVCGAIIPALATIIFNLLDYFVENGLPKLQPICSVAAGCPLRDEGLPYAIFDIAPGCAFAIVGICVNLQDRKIMLNLLVALVFLILAILAGDVLFLIARGYRLPFIIAVDVLAFVGLSWAIAEAG